MADLPCGECRGRCCKYPAFSPAEFELVKSVRGIPKGTIVQPMQHVQSYDPANKPGAVGYMLHRFDGTCPYLYDGKCSIYWMRPKVCKDYGVVKDLPCEYLYPGEAKRLQRERVKRSQA